MLFPYLDVINTFSDHDHDRWGNFTVGDVGSTAVGADTAYIGGTG